MANVAALPSITESPAGAPRLRDETLPGLEVRNLNLSVADSDSDSVMVRCQGEQPLQQPVHLEDFNQS